MHDVLKSKIQSPSQKFHNNFINFEKPKIFKKSQKVRSNAWKRRIRTLTKWRKTWSRLTNPWGWSLEWEREVWEGKRHKTDKRDQGKWDLKSCWTNIEAQSRQLEVLSFKKGRQMQLSSRCPKVSIAKKKLNGSRSYRGDRNFLDGSRCYQEAVQIAIKRSWRAR